MTSSGIPPDWNYNPSRWRHRLPIIMKALVGFGIAAYFSLYQLKMIKTVWNPFFHEQPIQVLTSSLAKSLPVPDVALSAFAYLIDAIACNICNE